MCPCEPECAITQFGPVPRKAKQRPGPYNAKNEIWKIPPGLWEGRDLTQQANRAKK